MNLLRITAPRRCGAILMLAAVAGGVAGPAAAQTPLADQPVFSNSGVPGNLVLALSVEFPTAVSVAHQGNFVAGTRYLGYFDPAKCYRYYVGTEDGATGTDVSHFYPVANTSTTFKCTDLTDTWSGSFMNWLTMQAIDPFRWALTGGYRRVDTTTTTILERAWATNHVDNGSDDNFPVIPTAAGVSDPLKRRHSPSNTDIADHTPLSFSSIKVSVRARGNQIWFTKDAALSSTTSGTPTHYTQGSTPNADALHMVYARVKVCDPGVGLESNCRAYAAGGFKPEGLLQQYADRIRFSAFGYLNDPTDSTRDGGVLRARQKFVGPTRFVPGSLPAANSATEWDALTGVQITNPDSADASATSTSLGVTVNNSGVINYLNKFGQEQKSYKRRDPVSELYYGALRYLRNIGHVPAWSNISGDSNKVRLVDGFPVITNWEDPLLYSCQRNFVLGIGDTNTNWDRNVPGSSGGSSEPSMPSQVSSDNAFDAVTATNKVGTMQGMGASLGTAGISSGSYLIAGMAWDANTRDIRTDDPTKPQTQGKQTVGTYWLDVLEFGAYVPNNQYYLAAKFGGFEVPENFNPNTHTGNLPQPWWHTNTDTVGSQPRPDNYYTVSRPDQMVQGLQSAFASIASQLQAFTTSFSTALPQVALEGVGSYASRYDSGNWTGEITANDTSFDPVTGAPTQTAVWNFGPKLATQIAGSGWNTNRNVITWNTSSSQGVPFRTASLPAAQLTALNTVYRSGNDSADYLDYLRGDPTHETSSTATGSAKAYRSRTGPVGDIVGSRARPVGAPAAPFSAATNPGYPAFRTTWQNRTPMLYVGTNAGMLHGIKASVTDADGGREVFAYVPGSLFQGANGVPAETGLQHRGNPDFTHKNMIDGPIAVFDIDLGKTPGGSGTPTWRSVLVGAMGKGGKGYFAIDVTDPSAFGSEALAAAKVMWEFTDPDLGYTYGEPAAVKTKKHGWVLIFGSGHNNADGIGYIFIVNPRTGTLLEKISTGAGTPANPAGLSQVQAYLPDRTDFTAESIYAGDLLGNLWRLDLTPATGAYASPTRIAELTDAAGSPVPVTSRPLVVIQPKTNRRFVTVGSGKLLANSDVGNTQPQGFYAIIDGTGNVFNTASTLPTGMSFPIRNSGADNRLLKLTNLTQAITLNFATQIGWWVDLGTATGGAGWRVITDSTSFLGTVAFAAMVPSGDVCTPSGKNRVYAVDLGTGQSVLQAGNVLIPFNDTLPGVITDLRFYSVNGKPRLVGGTDTGATGPLQGSWPTGTGVRRLNWRELQLAD